MGCYHGYHGYHGCGPWHAGPYAPGWYEPVDWYEEDWPMRRRNRRPRRLDREASADELEARLDDLREEVRRVEAELVGLRGTAEASTDLP